MAPISWQYCEDSMSQYKHYIWRCCLKEHLQIPVLSPCPLTSEQCKRHILTARGTWTRVGRHGSTRGNQQSNPLHIRRPRNVYALCAVLLLHTISRRPARMGVIWVDLLLCEEDWRALLAGLAGRSGMLRTLRGWNNNADPRDGGKQQKVLRNRNVLLNPAQSLYLLLHIQGFKARW